MVTWVTFGSSETMAVTHFKFIRHSKYMAMYVYPFDTHLMLVIACWDAYGGWRLTTVTQILSHTLK